MKSEAELTPAKIVEELDRYVVGQRDAKRAVAVALRNRWRRQQVEGLHSCRASNSDRARHPSSPSGFIR